MRMKLLEVLACPKCLGQLTCAAAERSASGEVETGSLDCAGCQKGYPIEAGIPRFVDKENYASSFGYQWNLFKSEQLDSINGTNLSEARFFSETGWTSEWMKGKWVLDAGCGAGRFLDVASKTGAEVVGLDISSAIDAAKSSLAGRANVHFVQASIFEPPFRTNAFDACYCIGVVQHTPDPQRAMQALPRVLAPGGRIAITAYERKPWTLLNTKYWVRPVTKRVEKQKLLGYLKKAMPVLFPITDVLFRLPLAGRVFMFTIPVANYVHERGLTRRQRYDWAILDTFDMLSPQYDQPRTQREVESALAENGIVEIKRLPSPGLSIVGSKAT
jgi:2-polyprenyl-3-methyl-5-hydroxy-6-metoxy-1,4-benzoquinol methylase